MSKEISKAEQPIKQEKAREKPEPVFATPEELKEKEELLKQLKEAKGPEKQRDIKLALLELDQKREQRIAEEKGEEIYDEKKGVFENIRFKETTDRKTGEASFISRHRGRKMVVLEKSPTEEIEPDKPYKAQVVRRFGEFIHVRIIE